jgi:hypothetical protein
MGDQEDTPLVLQRRSMIARESSLCTHTESADTGKQQWSVLGQISRLASAVGLFSLTLTKSDEP